VRAFLADATVANALDAGGGDTAELIRLAGGAPGRLIGREAWQASVAQANRLLDAATAPDRGARMRAALGQGASGARGKFSDTLEALTVLLHQRARFASTRGDEGAALGAAKAIEVVEHAKEQAYGNVNPQLVTASLLRQIAPLVE
jgi:DNA polymerase-3 subunit delta'